MTPLPTSFFLKLLLMKPRAEQCSACKAEIIEHLLPSLQAVPRAPSPAMPVGNRNEDCATAFTQGLLL